LNYESKIILVLDYAGKKSVIDGPGLDGIFACFANLLRAVQKSTTTDLWKTDELSGVLWRESQEVYKYHTGEYVDVKPRDMGYSNSHEFIPPEKYYKDIEGTVKLWNLLDARGIFCLGELAQFTPKELMQQKGFGKVMVDLCRKQLEKEGLRFGMKIKLMDCAHEEADSGSSA